MFKKLTFLIGITALLMAAPKLANASHIAGGEITYTCLGGNQYEINLNLFVDCLGFNPGPSQTINFISSCGGSATLNVPVSPATINGLEISQLCPSALANSTCNGGTLPGMWLFSYTGIVTLAPPCDTWTMSWALCCRNTAMTNVSSYDYYIEATLNSATALCNSSPQFTAQPIPYVCIGQVVNYSYGVIEPDGDSLFYSLIPALDSAGVSVTYNAGYSGTSPIPGITINSTTGLVTFTPALLGNFVVAILVQEYDSNGDLVGSVMRDIQFIVQSCTNVVPPSTGGAITSFSGNAVQTGPYSIEMCAGNCFNFTATYTDSDAADSLTYISNITAALPGATVTAAGINPLVLDIDWCSPAGTAGQNLTFTITIQDGACPIQGQQVFVYNVNILDATTASPDVAICGAQTAALDAYGGSIFNWSVISGPPMTPSNFSCNPCSSPVASPSATTSYQVVSNLSGTCDNIDTVTVFVAPSFTYTVTQSSTSSCLQDPVQLDVTALSPAGAYTFLWTPATNLSNATIQNPIATFLTPGTYTYTVTITSPSGCAQSTVLSISAAPSFIPQITAHNDTSFCPGGIANLSVTFDGGSTPPSCGLSASGGCGGVSISGTVGTGTGANTSTTWPAIFGNWYTSNKHQMLFTAAELNAAGITGGKIDQLDLNVTAINGISVYHQFTIKMKCTSITALGATWESGLVQVFNPATVNVIVGWNTMLLNNAFEWDGISNIVVEICSTEGAPYPNYTQSCISPYTTTTFTSCLFSYTDSFDMCPNLTNLVTPTNNRPNIRFHYCSVASNPANYTYSWTPASGVIADSSAQSTTGMPPTSMDYIITVTDIAGGCFDQDTVHVTLINVDTLTVTPAGPFCVNAPVQTLAVSVPTGTGLWSGTGITNTTTGTFDPAIAGAGSHQIMYNVSAACGTGADTITVVVLPQPDATITAVGSQCVTAAAAITLSAATVGGTWSGPGITSGSAGTFDPATAGVGNHLITYNIITPCTSQDTIMINVIPQLNATILNVGPFCTTDPSVTLTAADPSGTWTGTGITNATTGVFDPATAGPGTHLITYTIAGLCGAEATSLITVVATPVISFTSDTTEGCEPTTIIFNSTVSQPGGTYAWTFGDGGISNVANPSNTYVANGLYTVSLTYTNTTGCSASVTQTDMINIHSQPVAIFSYGPQPTTITNPVINFTDNSLGLINNWNWMFGAGGILGSSTQQNPYYGFTESGVYPVQLIVTNNFGCADTADNVVIIESIVVFYAPNAFSPDGNGDNDEFMVKGDGIDNSTFEMLIYDRWGEQIFKSNDIHTGWNGRRNNMGAELVQQEVYVWKVAFKDLKNQKHNYIGSVTIVK
ncbi:MAG TPA: PKD domain-containing protein [Bacteroidia bacterium]|jgi:gliding motility-associated-like protein